MVKQNKELVKVFLENSADKNKKHFGWGIAKTSPFELAQSLYAQKETLAKNIPSNVALKAEAEAFQRDFMSLFNE